MKRLFLATIAGILICSAAWSETVPAEQAETIVLQGEVLGSHRITNPFGFELLIRYEHGLYYCYVTLEKTFSGNDDMTKIGGCWDGENKL